MNLKVIETCGLKNVETGEIKLLPYRFIRIWGKEKLLLVQNQEDLFGILNENGEEIVSPKYKSINNFQPN